MRYAQAGQLNERKVIYLPFSGEEDYFREDVDDLG